MNMPSVMVATGSSLGCFSIYQPSAAARNAEQLGDFFGILHAAPIAADRMTISTGMRRCLPASVSSTWMINLPSSPGSRAASVTSATLPRTKQRAFFQHPLVELIVFFVGGAHVDVEVVHRRAGAFVHQVGEFQTLHAADHRTVVVEFAIAAAHAVHDAHRLGCGDAIAQDDIAVGRAGGIASGVRIPGW